MIEILAHLLETLLGLYLLLGFLGSLVKAPTVLILLGRTPSSPRRVRLLQAVLVLPLVALITLFWPWAFPLIRKLDDMD